MHDRIALSLNHFAIVMSTFMTLVLIIYMTITPIVPLPMIDSPSARHGVKSPESDVDAIVSVTREGHIFYFDQWVPPRELIASLRRARDRNSDAIARIRVDRRAPFGQVRFAVNAAREAGFTRVTFMVNPVETP